MVESYLRDPRAPEDAVFAKPDRALGPPDGRTVAVGVGSSVVLRFFREIPVSEGPELRIYEVGPDGAEARVAVSLGGVSFFELDDVATGPFTEYDVELSGLDRVSHVRIRGLDNRGEEPGFDLDAIEALR